VTEASAPALEIHTLADGGQTPDTVASWIAEFIDPARQALDIALYDLAVSGRAEDTVVRAIRRAAGRGVHARLAYNVDDANPIPVPPPPHTDTQLVEACGVPVKAIPGVPDLMHHKYLVRDGKAVWTGSTNWTDDAWTREENVIVAVRSPAIAAAYHRDFEELWTTARVAGTGEFEGEPVPLQGTGLFDGDEIPLRGTIRAWFSPGRGRRISHRIASAIGRARRRIRVCSPVVTSGPILGTLAEVAAMGTVDLTGVCDATQMREVLHQWHVDGHALWKIPAFLSVMDKAPFSGKQSTPYAPEAVHDYMHAKLVVADDVVFVGSYNLSHSGEENAENVLEIDEPAVAERLAAYVEAVRGRYPPLRLQDPGVLQPRTPNAPRVSVPPSG
jgi:phosphatidylserine/phosphatidylglycerophosphate/cardiolipin synthase-like enzyme